MTFTYDPATLSDITKIRWHLGDTVETSALWSDEDIELALKLYNDSWQQATLSLIENQIAKLSRVPGFKADWLTVSSSEPIAMWRKLLSDKRAEFGLAKLQAKARHTYRADSLQTEAPDYKDGT